MSSSTRTTPSPRQGPAAAPQVDESQLPRGQCRYILLLPEIKGQRCACVNFTLNRAMPSASCDCGHLACFHVKTTEPASENHEVEQLKQRVQALERANEELRQLRQEIQTLQEQRGRDQEMVVRVSELEDVVDKSREEASQEIKASYRNLTRAWHSIGELERQGRQFEEHFRHMEGHLRGVDSELQRLGQRQMELVDADIALEERVEALEESEHCAPPARGRRRRKSPSDPGRAAVDSSLARTISRDRSPESRPPGPATPSTPATSQIPAGPPSGPTSMPMRSSASGNRLWTVHISLMPTSSQPFPFERNTNAYKRCLSRGLHQMVVIDGYDAEAIDEAVQQAFGNLLQGRPWMPLQAHPCTAEQLAGLPMLRLLDAALLDGGEDGFDMEFLREHCAVCDRGGRIDSLYIAMRHESLSWDCLRRAPVYMEGLESAWAYDPYLDANDHPFEDDEEDDGDVAACGSGGQQGCSSAAAVAMTRPSAGDIVPSFPSLKRAASEMSRSSSFGSATATAAVAGTAGAATVAEGEGSRPKVPRLYPLPNIMEVRRGVKTS